MLRKICNYGIITVSCLLAVFLLLPRLAGYQVLAVLSGSMEPTIPVGSVIYYKAADPEALKVGDILTYRVDESVLVTHRIAEKNMEEQIFITKGDANKSIDARPVKFSQALGKVEGHLPYLGYVAIFFNTSRGKAVIGGLLAVVLILNLAADSLSSRRKKNDRAGNT